MYNFKLLQSFVAVADAGSFRGAAEKLNRSQSAVSTQVMQLEGQIGLILFERTTRRTKLTPDGEKLLVHMRRALNEIETGLSELRQAASGELGEIAMACVPSIAGSVLPPVLREFIDVHPRIKLRLVEHTSTALLAAVTEREVDFGIGPLVENEPSLLFEPIVDEPIFAVLPSPFRREGYTSISLEDLAANSVVMASNSAALRGNLDREISQKGVDIRSGYEVTHVQTMLGFARAGLGVALMPATTLPLPPDPHLQVLPVVSPPLLRSLCLISARGAVRSRIARELIALITERFQSDTRFSTITTPN
ncbi:LysR family transcriptional regulator [Yoonia sp.]|uniref:LysR family transcriptional regulator n=1 Tax=Yoonia sp. TaxID=2212373 RepID=UPI0040470AF6